MSHMSPYPTPPVTYDFDGINSLRVSMSTTFYPRQDHPSDFMVISSDKVFFSVHRRILERSLNLFGHMIVPSDESSAIEVDEHSTIMNLVLHCFYDFDPTNYKPTLDQLAAMLRALTRYGLPPKDAIQKGNAIYNLMLNTALSQPLDTYTVVCQYHLDDLAVEISRHLLSTPLHQLSDDQCLLMGPVYLRRLVFLHLGRTERLKKMLKQPPSGHPPTKSCDAANQQRYMIGPWNHAAAIIAWDANANTQASLLTTVLSPVVDQLECEQCRTAANERLNILIMDWKMVKNTI